jgi:chromosome segregation ATPase
MEYAQLESRISFLDSEYRKEKAELAQVRQKLEVATAEKNELTNRVETLEAELGEMRSQLSKVAMLENVIDHFKGEMKVALDEQQTQQKRALKDAERSRTIELESYVKSIADVRHELERQRNLDELISLARAETDRQAGVQVSFQQRLDTIAKQNDDQLRSISYLEEQHRTSIKHITELSAETADLFKQAKLHLSKIELLEREIPQFGQFQHALSKVQENVAAETERIQYQQAQVDRTLKTWGESREEWQRRLDEYETRMERYAEHYQRNLKALESLQAFQEQLQRTQHEFIELQRLNNDRQKGQLETWQSEQEQTLRQTSMETTRMLSELQRQINQVESTLKETTDALPILRKQNMQILKIIEEDVMSRAMAARDWQVRFEDLATSED